MIIDRTHRPWAIATVVVFAAAAIVYVPYAGRATFGASGGSPLGLAYGIAGFALMIFAGLLGARKQVPIWRIGRAQTWLRGHLWLGLLSLPLIFFHAGFSFGGPLTTVLMWLLIVVVVSGVIGAALQHYLPRLITTRVPMETIFEQIDRVRGQLVDESDGLVAARCGGLDVAASPRGDAAPGRTAAAGAMLATAVRVDADESGPLREFYLREMRPFLLDPDAPHPLRDRGHAAARFQRLRTVVPAAWHDLLDDLQNVCEEERQLIAQTRLHRLLHGWLLVHVPLSIALLLLAAVHVVMALRY